MLAESLKDDNSLFICDMNCIKVIKSNETYTIYKYNTCTQTTSKTNSLQLYGWNEWEMRRKYQQKNRNSEM